MNVSNNAKASTSRYNKTIINMTMKNIKIKHN